MTCRTSIITGSRIDANCLILEKSSLSKRLKGNFFLLFTHLYYHKTALFSSLVSHLNLGYEE